MQGALTYTAQAIFTSAVVMVFVGMTPLSGVEAGSPSPVRSASNSTDSLTSANSSPPRSNSFDSTETTIRSLLQSKCFRCHGNETQKAELNLSTKSGIFKGSESGPVIQPGKPEASLLYEMVHEGLMPPQKKDRLSKEEIETIRRWIKSGAPFTESKSLRNQVTQHDIIPLLYLRCTVCHGNRRTEARLDLRSKASMLKGGKSGPAFVPGKPSESLILKKIHSGEMPPRRQLVAVSIKPMESQEVELLTEWIAAGAPESSNGPDIATTNSDPLLSDADRNFRTFQSPKTVTIPTVSHSERVRNPIDAFILRKLEQNGLSLSPEADRLTLLRRVSFALTGLPPAPDEVESFLTDENAQAYETLIDRLLDSPQYGEHQARFWLDLAGYADSEGVQDSDVIRPQAWRYRDYVIRAFNDDKPYDRFLLEQIAGDELADYEHADVITQEIYDNLVATGFLRMAEDGTFANITGFVPDRMEVIALEMEILSSAIMGLSLKCARCHSHKFDPIPHRDYYRLLAVFKGAFDEHDWLRPTRQSGKPGERDRYLPYVTTGERKEWESHQKRIDESIAELQSDLKRTQQELTAKHVEIRLEKLPVELHEDLRKMLSTPAERRTGIQKYLAVKFEKMLRIHSEELMTIAPQFKQAAESTKGQIESLNRQRKPEPLIRALWDRGEPSPTYVSRRGNYLTPGRLVGPGVPSLLTDGKTPLEIEPSHDESRKTGRRLAFAKWLIEPDHPLTARVLVNRVWKEHFGKGIVETLDDFGNAGAMPSHPELLDWLATELVRHGWSIKRLHRMLLTSATYRQSSRVGPLHEKHDPDNQWFSRMPLKRMRAEMLRDSLLFISERLDVTPFGPADEVSIRGDGLVTSVESDRGRRRSIYVLQRRSQIPTILENFDLPRMSPNCIQRPISTVTPQALHLMNNGLVHELGEHLAARITREVETDREQQVVQVYLIVLNRKPTPEEQIAARNALDELTAHWKNTLSSSDDAGQSRAQQKALTNYCHALINSAAFIYID